MENLLMKTNIIIAAVLLVTACSPASTVQTPVVIDRLQKAADAGRHMYAMQDALCYGQGWHIEEEDLLTDPIDKSDISLVCGDFPAIAGFELGDLELDRKCNLDGVNFEFMRKAATTHAERGGIVTFSWHCNNPVTGGNAWDVTCDSVVEAVLPGGEKHEIFAGWLETVADFLDTMRDSEGNLIPIIFRPWHENTGSWFWWGKDLCSDEQYKALWQMTYDCLAVKHGLQMAWAYSPGSTLLRECAMARYPGDEIIDIIGVDNYARGHWPEADQSFIDGLQSDLEYLSEVAGEHGLLMAVTETGTEGQEYDKWWTGQLLPAIEGYNVCYVLTWRNAWDADHPGHWFSTFPGAPTEADFVEYYKSDNTLFLNDIK